MGLFEDKPRIHQGNTLITWEGLDKDYTGTFIRWYGIKGSDGEVHRFWELMACPGVSLCSEVGESVVEPIPEDGFRVIASSDQRKVLVEKCDEYTVFLLSYDVMDYWRWGLKNQILDRFGDEGIDKGKCWDENLMAILPISKKKDLDDLVSLFMDFKREEW